MPRRTLVLIVPVLVLSLPAAAWGGAAGIGGAFAIDRSSTSVHERMLGSGTAAGQTGALGQTGGTERPTGPSASPSPASTQGPLAGAGFIVLGVLLGAFLLLRTRLLRCRS